MARVLVGSDKALLQTATVLLQRDKDLFETAEAGRPGNAAARLGAPPLSLGKPYKSDFAEGLFSRAMLFSRSAQAALRSVAIASGSDTTICSGCMPGRIPSFATVDGTFLFFDPDHGPLFSECLRFAPRVLAALRHDRIAVHPLCPVSVHVFSSLDRFNDHCSERHYLPESGRNWGIYDRRRGEIDALRASRR